MTYNKLGFQLTGLRTISFAQIDTAYKKTGNTNLLTNLGFGVNPDDHSLTCNVKFSFEKKTDQPFLIIEVQGLFNIEKSDFATKIAQQQDKIYLISKELATHIAVLTVGSARGVLHAKTENTVYNQYLLPTINLKDMIEDDIEISFD